MKRVGEAIKKILDPLCIDATLVDIEPDRAGLQADCQVSDVRRASPQGPAREAVLRAMRGRRPALLGADVRFPRRAAHAPAWW
jgi:hypothetical protein